MTNPLNDMPSVRRVLYLIQWLTNGVCVVLSALFGFIYGSPDEWPMVFLAVLAVAPVLWSYLGITAQNNITPADPPEGYEFRPIERDPRDIDYPLF